MEEFKKEAEEFLKICGEFQLGNLPTETQNQKTIGLSEFAQQDLEKGIDIIKNIDLDVFRIVKNKIPEILKLKSDIKKTLSQNGRIFLVGCGATGRLSLAIETLWRMKNGESNNQVISFMAGGDVALIHSVEKFEDYPEFGVRQMMELDFSENDLLIATTEGGETPFVIGATNKAADFSKYHPYFLYCNPDDILMKTTQRSREVIENNKINKINLSVGPMALTGSTRMQATTILMYVVGLALLNVNEENEKIELEVDKIISWVETNSFHFLKDFIVHEADIYQNNGHVFYETDGDLGISILTDTTERSPTFSLFPFENEQDEIKNPSLSYILFPKVDSSTRAWEDLLKRKPRAFFWPEVTDRTTIERLYGFDFSSRLLLNRKKYAAGNHHHFKIYFNKKENSIHFDFDSLQKKIVCNDLSFLSVHMILKILLNNHSTLLMGRMGRYKSNLMTWVRASNFKLIDRSVRYAQLLLKENGKSADYKELVHLCFKYKDQIKRDQSLVIKMVEEYKN